MTNPVESLLAWLWDARGRRRGAQLERELRTERRIRANRLMRRSAIDQVRRTQRIAEEHRDVWSD